MSSFSQESRSVVFQSLSCVQLFATPWTAAHQAPPTFIIFQSLFKLMSIESLMSSHHLILCCPLLLLPLIFPGIRVFSNEWALCIRCQTIGASASVLPMNTPLISLKTDWFDLLAVQGTLKNLRQHNSSKASILWCSAFSMVQLRALILR